MLQRSQASVGWRRTAARSTEAEEDATPPEGAVPLPPLAADAAARWLSNCRGAQTREMRHQMGAGRQASDLLLKEAAKGWMAGRGSGRPAAPPRAPGGSLADRSGGGTPSAMASVAAWVELSSSLSMASHSMGSPRAFVAER